MAEHGINKSGTDLTDNSKQQLQGWSLLGTTLLPVLLWVIAGAVVAVLALNRYNGAIGSTPLIGEYNADFGVFFHAAQVISHGKSPYTAAGKYVYFTPLAIFLSIFISASELSILKAWTIAELAALILAIFMTIKFTKSSPIFSWETPVIFTVCAGISLHIWATVMEFYFSNDDFFVLLFLVIAGFLLLKECPILFGICVGIITLIKVWPVIIIIAVFQRGVTKVQRIKAIAALGLMIVIGIVANLIPQGVHEITLFIKSIYREKTQDAVSNSITGIPHLLFSRSGLARPIFISHSIEYIAVGLFGLWVLGMLLVALYHPSNRMLLVFNIMLFLVLVNPSSHIVYSILALPVVWFWITNYRILFSIKDGSARVILSRVSLILAIFVWCIVQEKAWPDGTASASSVETSFLFMVNLVLFTASVLGSRVLLGGAEPTADRAGPQPSVSTTQRSQPPREVAPSS